MTDKKIISIADNISWISGSTVGSILAWARIEDMLISTGTAVVITIVVFFVKRALNKYWPAKKKNDSLLDEFEQDN